MHPTTDTLTKIAADLNGSLIAYRRVTAHADDTRWVIAYSFGSAGNAWVTAVVDATTGQHLGGTSHRDPITAGNVNGALEREQADAPDFGACALGHNDPIYVDDNTAECAVCGHRFIVQ
jgi:hypothetical protein